MIILSLVAAALLVAADQVIKYLVIVYIPYQPYADTTVTVIPGLFGLSHTHNTGAAWSIFGNMTWLLAVFSAIAALVVLYLICRRKLSHPLASWALVLILAGAVGNLIDRVLQGYVVDMFRFLFVNFPVFNFADVCITIGGVLICVYILFFYGKEKKLGDHPSAS